MYVSFSLSFNLRVPADECACVRTRVPHTYRARPRRTRRSRARPRSVSPRGALFVSLGTADRTRCTARSAVHAWAQIRHRDDCGPHASRYMYVLYARIMLHTLFLMTVLCVRAQIS